MSENKAGWQGAVQKQFRQLMLDRVRTYLAHGNGSMPPNDDRETPISVQQEFEAVAARMEAGSLRQPHLLDYMRRYPVIDPTVESFLYWSQETFGKGKPIISITHVAIMRGINPACPETLVASRQIFATHYLPASLSVTALTHPAASGDRYLLYSRHSRVDLFKGVFAGMVRQLVEKRIRSEAPAALEGMKRRLESGEPADTITAR